MLETQPDQLLGMFEKMCLIRVFEETLIDAKTSGEFPGPMHPAVGQEAVYVGACAPLTRADYILGTHRSHGHPIAKGADLNRLMAEIFGKADGVCGGKGGSMHLADFSVGVMGASGILASQVPVAVGLALSQIRKQTNNVTVVFFGDGAAQEGAVHEAMNLASVWRVPVIFICENNNYYHSVRTSTRSSTDELVTRASSYNMPGAVVDGQDVLAVSETVSAAVVRARNGAGPTFVEARTYRFLWHSSPEPEVRPEEELNFWRARDPIEIMTRRLIELGVADSSSLSAIQRRADSAVAAALSFARKGAFPEVGELQDCTYG